MLNHFWETLLDAFIKGAPTLLAVLISAGVALFVMSTNNKAQRRRDHLKLRTDKLEALTFAILDWQATLQTLTYSVDDPMHAFFELNNTKLHQVRMLQKLYFPELHELVEKWIPSQTVLVLSTIQARKDKGRSMPTVIKASESAKKQTDKLVVAIEGMALKVVHRPVLDDDL
jgi:hypothetical protein